MGKGDVRTRRGKIFNGSYGKTRPHRLKKTVEQKKTLSLKKKTPAS
jgi:30S ribosomal protein S31